MSLVSRCLLWYEGNVTVPHSAEGDDCVCNCFFVDPRIFSPLSNFPIRLYTSKICHLFRVLMNDGVCECACTTLVLVCTSVVPSYAETRKKAGPIFFNLLIHGLIHGIWLYGSQREEIFSPTARKTAPDPGMVLFVFSSLFAGGWKFLTPLLPPPGTDDKRETGFIRKFGKTMYSRG